MLGLAFLAGILVVTGGLLIFSASIGIAYYGLTLQIEGAIAIILLLVAGDCGLAILRRRQSPTQTGENG